jgi:DNA polymerase III delta prime subunit
MLRRSMEKRSFKCRVWFHIEEPASLQPAILSRCIVRKLASATAREFKRSGTIPDIWKSVWNNPAEMELPIVK